MRTITAIAAAFVLALFVAPAGQAHFIWHHKHMTLAQKVRYFERSVNHDRAKVARDQGYLRTLAHAHVEQIVGARPLERLITYRARWHRHAFRWHQAQLKRYTRKLEAAALPAHYRGWYCITNGAYPGAHHEGNGYNGSFTGPLGMTTPWMGHYPPGRDWVHSDVVAVYRIAEKESVQQGFSYAWMKGQWPNTYPPCASFF